MAGKFLKDTLEDIILKITKILKLNIKGCLEINFDGGGNMTAKLTKLSQEDTDKLLK